MSKTTERRLVGHAQHLCDSMITTVLRSGFPEVRDEVDCCGRTRTSLTATLPRNACGNWSRQRRTSVQTAPRCSRSPRVEHDHAHPARANILRALDILADATVLEIGSGFGPITAIWARLQPS